MTTAATTIASATTDTTTGTDVSTIETMIIYASTFRHLINQVDPLISYKKLRSQMTEEMRSILFELLSIHLSMLKRRQQGMIPVLQPYRRLEPIFYYLSGTEYLYYTIEDVLLEARSVPQEILDSDDAHKSDNERIEHLVSKGETNGPEYRELERVRDLRRREGAKLVYSPMVQSNVIHRKLINLTQVERERLLNLNMLTMRETFDRFAQIQTGSFNFNMLRSSNTQLEGSMAPLYNFEMSMEDTHKRIIAFGKGPGSSFPEPGVLESNSEISLSKEKERVKRGERMVYTLGPGPNSDARFMFPSLDKEKQGKKEDLTTTKVGNALRVNEVILQKLLKEDSESRESQKLKIIEKNNEKIRALLDQDSNIPDKSKLIEELRASNELLRAEIDRLAEDPKIKERAVKSNNKEIEALRQSKGDKKLIKKLETENAQLLADIKSVEEENRRYHELSVRRKEAIEDLKRVADACAAIQERTWTSVRTRMLESYERNAVYSASVGSENA